MTASDDPPRQSLLDALAALAGIAAGDVGTEDLLVGLVDLAARHLVVDGAGVVICEGEDVRFVHASDQVFDGPELVQQLHREGPCRDAIAFAVEVVVDDLRDPVQTAWPTYVDRTLAVGFLSVVAVPLVSDGRVWGALDLYRRQAGTWQPEELQWVRLLAHLAASYLEIAADRDAARSAQRELAHASTHDALTGLPNRALLFDRLEHALHTAQRHRRVVAVMFVDLDRFKGVNDTFGHAAGDLVLTTVAARMGATLRQGDTLARLAGDEFVLVCEDLPQSGAAELQQSVEAVVARLRQALGRSIPVGEVDLVVSASIGVALSDQRTDADGLLADADGAMYVAKQHTPGRLGEFARETGPNGQPLRPPLRLLEHQLAEAEGLRQLRIHYQPIVDAAGALHAVEALVRWQHPVHGLLPAAEFIDLATHSGSIVGIGRWVIAQTCAQMALWRDRLGPAAPATVYVNVCARELVDPLLGPTISAALERHGLDPGHLGLELLESSFIDPQVLVGLQEQQRLGHPLSVDDFGTGYSSLSRLVELPVRLAKIDKSFVAGITTDPRRRALVAAVVTVAASLDLRVIAEGVETEAQALEVAAAGCDYLQGYWCGKPQPAEALTARWLSSTAHR
ncbi:EAL domain-containing protein [Kineococcus sp. NBC_00420]|uniref:putative bifunctional diguanylate cyclase/phosphodiesterase n=1 Tax=Kineococcus sp. NBC_00420 TaxID=2903564 RepID=UPI002E21D9A7